MLAKEYPTYSYHVVQRARRRFSAQILLAISERRVDSAVQIYEQTLALPQTATELMLKLEGYQVNGPWREGIDNLVICHKGTIPHLLKGLSPKEISRASSLSVALQQQPNMSPYLTHFELKAHEKRMFMIMPFYPSSLEVVAQLSVEEGSRLFTQVGDAIRFLHSLNFNHMDIKPANICLRAETGDFVLIDLGSVAMKLSVSESTVVYVPSDFQPRDKRNFNNKYKAVDTNDWLMLGMTIAEKVYGLSVGGSAPPPTVAALKEILSTDGAFDELIGLFGH